MTCPLPLQRVKSDSESRKVSDVKHHLLLGLRVACRHSHSLHYSNKMKAIHKLGWYVSNVIGPTDAANRHALKSVCQNLHKCANRSSPTCNKVDSPSSKLAYYDNALSQNNRIACQQWAFISKRTFSTPVKEQQESINYIDAKEKDIYDILLKDMILHPNFLSESEEKSLLAEVDKYMRRLRYEFDHWDNAIHGYRETEKKSWNDTNSAIIKRVRDLAFHSGVSPLAFVHVLDIAKEGYIKPHVDAVRFCGDTIAGMCLLSSCVMRLALEKDNSKYGDIYLPRRCLYIMKDRARYDFTHEVLKEEESVFKGNTVPRDRRISVICRNEPRPEDTS